MRNRTIPLISALAVFVFRFGARRLDCEVFSQTTVNILPSQTQDASGSVRFHTVTWDVGPVRPVRFASPGPVPPVRFPAAVQFVDFF